MSTFAQYLTEATKSYDYKIKVAGELDKGFASKLESALAKFDVSNMSAGKQTPIMTLPLDFPALSNEQVTIFDVTTNYPEATRVMHEYLSDILRIPATHLVVRKPGEPTEEYQDQMQVAKKSEYASKLQDIEYRDAPKVKSDEVTGDKYNMSLMRELLKTKTDQGTVEKGTDNKVGNVMPNEDDKTAKSPINTGPGPMKGNPVPTHPFQGFKA